jgi:hypothetical protein
MHPEFLNLDDLVIEAFDAVPANASSQDEVVFGLEQHSTTCSIDQTTVCAPSTSMNASCMLSCYETYISVCGWNCPTS